MSPKARLLAGAGSLLVLFTSVALGVGSPAQGAVTGSWKVDCTYVRTAMDDPIVFPNQPGASHAHDFFGNTGVSAYSTYSSLAGVTSTCAHRDFSSYWVPSLYRDGKKITPTGFIAYYENRFAVGEQVEAFPPGFRMIFGDKNATSAAQLDDHISWACSDNSQFGAKQPPASCASGAVQLRLMWPYCWDGRTPATGSYNVGFAPGGKCPATRPHRLPTLRTNLYYDVTGTSGAYTLSSGSPYSVHADFINAWDQPTLEGLVTRCLNAGVSCGHFRGTSPGRTPPPIPTIPPIPTDPTDPAEPTGTPPTPPGATPPGSGSVGSVAAGRPAPSTVAGGVSGPIAGPGAAPPVGVPVVAQVPGGPAGADPAPGGGPRVAIARSADDRELPATNRLAPPVWGALAIFAVTFLLTGARWARSRGGRLSATPRRRAGQRGTRVSRLS
ncbi:MAG TPA: DUF1996 domain-containing protein, partial [Catenuloplanes sp.]|jgi:hypothetical protein